MEEVCDMRARARINASDVVLQKWVPLILYFWMHLKRDSFMPQDHIVTRLAWKQAYMHETYTLYLHS
jgi:hypothetical protein